MWLWRGGDAFWVELWIFEVQYNGILSSCIPAFLEDEVRVQGKTSYSTPGADKVKGLAQWSNSDSIAELGFKSPSLVGCPILPNSLPQFSNFPNMTMNRSAKVTVIHIMIV